MRCIVCNSEQFFIDTTKRTATCSSCHNIYSLDQILGNRNSGTNNLGEYRTSDFEIIGGVLKHYRGSGIDVVVPEGVIEIGGSVGRDSAAFEHMTSIRSVRLPTTLKKIGNGAFHGCSSLSSVELPASLREIGASAFFRCSSLSQINLPDSLREIGSGAFAETGIRSIKIPDSVNEIGSFPFSDCKNLKSVQLPKNIKEIGHGLFSRTALEEYRVPYGVTFLDSSSFGDCHNLRKIIIPDSVTKIGDTDRSNCFHGPFSGCDKLADIQYPGRFSLEVFLGSLYYERLNKGLCPVCGIKLSLFRRCKKCGKQYKQE